MPASTYDAAIDPFLRKVRQGLSSLPAAERDDIIAELRSHLRERQSQGVGNPLEGFAPPERLAAEFVSEHALRGALGRGTSLALGQALLVAGRESVLALLALLPLLLLQLTALGLLVSAACKHFLWNDVGLWADDRGFNLGVLTDHAGRHELLGWWGLPLFALAGVLLFLGSNRAMMSLARWMLRSGRRAKE